MPRLAALVLLVLASCEAFAPRMLPLRTTAAAPSVAGVLVQPGRRGAGGLLAAAASADGDKEASALIGRCAVLSAFQRWCRQQTVLF